MTRMSALLLSAIVLSACGSSSDSYYESTQKSAAAGSYDYDNYSYDSFAEESIETEMPEGQSGESMVNDTSRKLIKTVDMSIETNDLSTMIDGISNRIEAYGGYIEYSYVYNGSESSYKSNKSANITARIPSGKLDAFLDNVEENSNIISKNINVTDVTLSYVDTEAKKDSLVTQQKRLLELMAEAESVEDIITIEDRLSNIEYELDSAQRQIRSFENQIDYSTVALDIKEVKEFTPVEPVSRIQRMKDGFVDSVISVFEGLLDFGVGFVIAIPFLIVWAIIITIIVLIIRLIIKHHKKKKAKKIEKLKRSELKADLVEDNNTSKEDKDDTNE